MLDIAKLWSSSQFSCSPSGVTANMASLGYTCITCRVAFTDADLQRAHYKTDWHRYNLKRKVAELPPVTAENFQQRVLAQRAEDMAHEVKQSEFCQICKKHFTSENSYQSHIRSRKHKESVAALEKKNSGDKTAKEVEEGEISAKNKKNLQEDADMKVHQEETSTEVVDSNKLAEEESSSTSDFEPEPLERNECLFCPHAGEDLEANLHHMSRVHGFFLPDLDYLIDIKGLISYLCEKVGVGNMCLYCNERGKSFYSVEAVQQHMVDKCHCKIFFEGDATLEYAEFYDYSKSYPGHDEASNDTSRAVALPDTSLEVNDDLELVLPSGTKVGHRSMKHIYKQRAPTLEQRKSTLLGRLLSQYRALGWKGYTGEGAEQRKRDEAWSRRMQQARATKLSVKSNKMQKHFRPQVVF